MKLLKKGQIVWDSLVPWIIGILVLVIGVGIAIAFSDKGKAAITALKNNIGFG